MRSSIWILISLLSLSAFAQTQNLNRSSIVEDNDLYIGVNDKARSNVTEEMFNMTLDRVQEIYGPMVAAKKKELSIVRQWDDGTVNAYAEQTGSTWKITMFGGLARHPAITQDAFALVACHEIGHHMGGKPKKTMFFISIWASAEGQSDYYGALKCLRRYFQKDNNADLIKGMVIDKAAQDKCREVWVTDEDIAICERTAMAGLSLGKLFEELKELETPVELDTPDLSVVSKTNYNGYPDIQCRVDTYFQAALCNKPVEQEVDGRSVDKGQCAINEGYTQGYRPHCWFKPPARRPITNKKAAEALI